MDLNQVTLPSLSLDKSIPFYLKLGLQLIVDASPRYARFQCPDGNSSLSLHLVDDLPTGAGVVIYFECKHLDQEYDRLTAEGVIFDTVPTDQTWLWREVALSDPDGNRIILYHAGDNRLNPPWRIN
ncbi:VOC family protein [Reichenbachiella agariperforans]|nr:VOC family protein [Reichenbachiella agariperforans]MBU2915525.1 VOC family protein [Reichenbachiella agariperforans]